MLTWSTALPGRDEAPVTAGTAEVGLDGIIAADNGRGVEDGGRGVAETVLDAVAEAGRGAADCGREVP